MGPHLSVSPLVPLEELGFPCPLSLLVQHLLDGQECAAYETLDDVLPDLHLLLLEPDRFLFNASWAPNGNGRIPLRFRRESDGEGYTEKLYGRETEVTQIQEAFCRVSAGRSEAFFIGEGWRHGAE